MGVTVSQSSKRGGLKMSKLGRGGWLGCPRSCCGSGHALFAACSAPACKHMDGLLLCPALRALELLDEYLVCYRPAFMLLVFCAVFCCGNFALTLACLLRLCKIQAYKAVVSSSKFQLPYGTCMMLACPQTLDLGPPPK